MSNINDPTEHSLFKNFFKHIRLLSHDKVSLRSAPPKIKHSQNPNDKIGKSIPLLCSADKIFHTNRILPQKALRQFKKGQYNPEDTIDLHGMTITEAKSMLDKFMEESYQANFFVVAVIHGKGRNNADQPILKNKVNEWLREYSHVIAYCSAPTQEGGVGKVYIMLEKSR